ncbi:MULTISPECIES: sulfate ABC transporter permease subunit CysT [Cellulomonas]|uniref:Sulfate transport system permease protein CysT n=1 Tax=Cellulomonas gilvus (strain ATCC 13127 / NRRL B-14078) TaxID=593907 RepID=F8A7S1_CELGA|nr:MULTISPECIES: sulfate ABC transporter permease subunit CysT [Cellulomonas]AEI13604.1 sulfate ABC transporter, inner membrane subunit CysT [Cellulomonas gilvus ATCC 13127]MCR6688649.1 sulfate ABC transporter permease subunit CysT [Cellulomonas sp.]
MSLLTHVDRATPPASGRGRRPGELTGGAGLGLGVGVLWLSLLVLLPIAAIVSTAFDDGIAGFWAAVTDDEALAAIRFTVGAAAFVTVVNAVVGTLIAWVLVRDSFPGKRVLEVVIDIPFALPTIVAGLVLITLYGPSGPFGINLVGTQAGVVLALLFVTLPFVVRSVQPVLIDADREVEQAAASLGASGPTIFRRVILPTVTPAVVSGAALSFARALGEFGSVILISANLIGKTQVSSSYILKMIESQEVEQAAAVATLLLGVAVVVLVLLDVLQRRTARRG